MSLLLGFIPGLLVLAILITGGYFALRYFHPEKPFRYYFSPFHALAILVIVGAVLLKIRPPEFADAEDQRWLSLLLPFSLMILMALLAFDGALQFIIRDRTKLYWVEAIVIVILLTRTLAKFM